MAKFIGKVLVSAILVAAVNVTGISFGLAIAALVPGGLFAPVLATTACVSMGCYSVIANVWQ